MLYLDCLQSAFSLKIRQVLISSSAIANHDVIITPSILAARGFAARACLAFVCRNFARKIRDCSQSSSILCPCVILR